jgi:hypothetical protein
MNHLVKRELVRRRVQVSARLVSTSVMDHLFRQRPEYPSLIGDALHLEDVIYPRATSRTWLRIAVEL